MASNDLKGQNFSCKFLLSQSIVIVDQDGVFFCGQQNGMAAVVFVEDWLCCGKCCFCGRLVLLWQVLFIVEVHSQRLIRSLLSPNWTRRLLQNGRFGSLGISDLDYRCSINRLVLSWSFYWMSSFPIYSPDNLGNLSVLGKSLINAVKVWTQNNSEVWSLRDNLVFQAIDGPPFKRRRWESSIWGLKTFCQNLMQLKIPSTYFHSILTT